MAKRVLQPASVRAKGSYSPGWEVSGGKLIYVAGQIPWDSEGRTVAKGDVAGQTRQVFENIGAVLAESGATLDDIVKETKKDHFKLKSLIKEVILSKSFSNIHQ